MSIDDAKASGESLAWLEEAVRERVLALPGDDRGDYVGSALSAVNRALGRVQAEGLASGRLFCEWGSGVGGVCVVAALNGFTPIGIEIQGELVEAARSMAKDLGFPVVPMGARCCAIARRRTSLYRGIGRVNHPRVGVDGDGENLNEFNVNEH